MAELAIVTAHLTSGVEVKVTLEAAPRHRPVTDALPVVVRTLDGQPIPAREVAYLR